MKLLKSVKFGYMDKVIEHFIHIVNNKNESSRQLTTYPLSKPQQAIWNMEQFHGGGIANIISSVFFIRHVDIQNLQTSLNKLVELYDALRIRLLTNKSTPMQYICKYSPEVFDVLCFENQCDFDSWIHSFSLAPFDLNGKLYSFIIVKIGRKIGFACKLHHLIADAWSIHMLVNAVVKILEGEVPGNYSYLEYLVSEHKYIASARFDKDRAYFLSHFEECTEPVYLSDKQTSFSNAAYLSSVVEKNIALRIQDFCTNYNISAYSLFMSAFATYIFRIKGERKMYIGTAVLNRSGRKEKATAGMFVNTVPVLMTVDETSPILNSILINTESIAGIFRHQKYQYIDMLKDIREKYDFNEKLYDVVLSYQNASLSSDVITNFHFCGQQGESLNVHINDRHCEGLFYFDYTYQSDCFSGSDVKHMHEHVLNLIIDMIEHPGKAPQDLKMLSDREHYKITRFFNSTTVNYPKDKCIHQLFEEQAEKTPDAVAVTFENTDYSYRKVNEMANSLAHILRRKGVVRNDIVAVITTRSYITIVAQLAVLKAGGAFMPVEPTNPADRIAFMLEDSSCKAVLTLGIDITGIDMSDETLFHGDINTPCNSNMPDDLCYVIYTSGSTGAPKGTMISHRNLNNFCNNNHENIYQRDMIKMGQVVLATSSIGFDIFIFEVFLTLLNGLRVIVPADSQINNGNELAKLIRLHDVDVIHSTPTKLFSLMKFNSFTASLEQIEVIMVGAEIFPEASLKTLKKHTNAQVYNGYGPTETTIGVCFDNVTDRENDITIGRPIANTKIYILDRHMNPMPIGKSGELCISGDSVGKGYLNSPNQTAERFCPSPFSEDELIYKTGDIAHWCEDGRISYIGRMDSQIKIRGLRIELGEIEAIMAAYEKINQVAVIERKDDNERHYICAYYISDEVIDEKHLRAELTKTLPRYMIPNHFTKLEAFPTTPSGKIDRKSLPSPDFIHVHSDVGYIAPVSEREKTYIQVLESVLGVAPIGMSDDFFDMGGDSLKVIELTANAYDKGFIFNSQDVYEHPTPAELLKFLSENKKNTTQYDVSNFTSIHNLLKKSISVSRTHYTKIPMGDILITGATGWLGVHILDEFLSTQQGIAYCLVRGKNPTDSESRLREMLKYYFGDKHISNNRIVVLSGCITEQIATDSKFDTIINCAANVRHYGAYEDFDKVNVEGTKNIIYLAKKQGARLLHISTTSISGNSFELPPNFPVTVFSETDLFIGQPLDNVYIKSKFEAEVALLQAKLEELDAVIIRVGNLTNRHTDLLFQKNYQENATLSRLKAFVELGLYPEQLNDFPLEFSPVCDTAKAIIRIGQSNTRDYSVFHAYNPIPVRFEDFAQILTEKGARLHSAPIEQFASKIKNTPHIEKVFVNDINGDGGLNYHSRISLKNDFTTEYLGVLDFKWKDITNVYINRYIEYLLELRKAGG